MPARTGFLDRCAASKLLLNTSTSAPPYKLTVIKSEAIIAIRHSLFKGPAECAKRSAAQPGRRAESFYQVFLALLQISFNNFFTSTFWESERSAYPSLILPRRPAHSAGPTPRLPPRGLLSASWPKKWCFKRPLKTYQILMSFQHRFLSVLAPFWEAKMAPKSTKNRSKLGFRAFLFRHGFLYWFLIEFWSQLRPLGSQKTLFFH